MTKEILFSQEKHIGIVTLNRPQALNALTFSMILTLQKQLQNWEEDIDVHAIVIRASGDRAFCAGGDIRWLYDTGRCSPTETLLFFKHEYQLNYFISKMTKPYIALMDGITMGGGVGISLHGSHSVACEKFIFAMPETAIGFFPDIGASHLLARCKGAAGIYLGLTGSRLDDHEAHHLGLVKYRVASSQIDTLLSQLIEADLFEDSHTKVHNYLQMYAAPKKTSTLPTQIEENFQFNSMEAIMESLGRREDTWCQNTLQTLTTKSPFSLKVTLSQILKAKTKSLAECLHIDYCLVNHFIKSHDFYEGVRALIIDKDKSPHWQPASFKEITQEQVEHYFQSSTQENFL